MDKNTVISMLVGAIASALVSWFFYWLGGRSLAKEAQRLHDLNVLLLRAFEEAGLATLNRDASGQPIWFSSTRGSGDGISFCQRCLRCRDYQVISKHGSDGRRGGGRFHSTPASFARSSPCDVWSECEYAQRLTG